MLRKVALDPVFFSSSEGRIRQNNIDAVGGGVADVGAGKRIVMANETRILDAMQEHVGYAEHVRKLLLFAGAERLLHDLLVLGSLHIAVTHVPERTGEKAACTAGGIEQ